MKKFYVCKGNLAKGPFTVEKLQEQHISPFDPIWCEGFSQCKRAKDISELKTIFIPNERFKNQFYSYDHQQEAKYYILGMCTMVGAGGLFIYYLLMNLLGG